MAGDDVIDESSPPGSDFLAGLCMNWEAEARAVEALGCRLVIVRNGIVLARHGGALKKMLPPFLFFVGGPIADGRQYFSWVALDDWTALVAWALATTSVTGALNGTAPEPVTNAQFSKALGRALHRPSWIPVPGFALRLLVGELADAGLITGQRVVPKRALSLGFTFTYPSVDAALARAVRPARLLDSQRDDGIDAQHLTSRHVARERGGEREGRAGGGIRQRIGARDPEQQARHEP